MACICRAKKRSAFRRMMNKKRKLLSADNAMAHPPLYDRILLRCAVGCGELANRINRERCIAIPLKEQTTLVKWLVNDAVITASYPAPVIHNVNQAASISATA